MTGIAWARLMQVGLGRLRLAPEVFWNLTPAEFMLMAGLGEGRSALSRAGLAELSARFPDVPAARPAELE
jgi:uncharacterized phage protein (TIGR02216 family)